MKRLKDNITSKYFEAANQLKSKHARRRIVAFVESYDDIFFWRTVLSKFENEERYFEVMLPSRGVLSRGKKSVLMSLANGGGPNMIACVDADYDYLLQKASPTSKKILENPYVFHTFVYAIENYQCYAQSLHNVCVMVTLNDHAIFDFPEFLKSFSEICHPLFVWSIWAYRYDHYTEFTLTDFCRIAEVGNFDINNPQNALNHLRNKVDKRIRQLQRHFPNASATYKALAEEMKSLGVYPENTYLYIQGHHIVDVVVAPLLTKVCNRLRMERETEIHRTAIHKTQMYNEMSCYENSVSDVRSMLKRNTGYITCKEFIHLQDTVEKVLFKTDSNSPSNNCERTAPEPS